MLSGQPPPKTMHDSKISEFKLNPFEAKDYYDSRNQLRHGRHWKALATLSACVSTETKPALDSCRLIVFQFLHRGDISKVRSRQQTSLWGWTEALFEAVFGCVNATIMRHCCNPLLQPRLLVLLGEGMGSTKGKFVVRSEISFSNGLHLKIGHNERGARIVDVRSSRLQRCVSLLNSPLSSGATQIVWSAGILKCAYTCPRPLSTRRLSCAFSLHQTRRKRWCAQKHTPSTKHWSTWQP